MIAGILSDVINYRGGLKDRITNNQQHHDGRTKMEKYDVSKNGMIGVNYQIEAGYI